MNSLPRDERSREIPLTKGQTAIVDAADYEWLNQWKWCATSNGRTWYAVRWVSGGGRKRVAIFMHRVILGIEKGLFVDHIDHDGLNNRRANLRPVTNSQNLANSRKQARNTSGYKGVTWSKKYKVWVAHIVVNQRQRHVGQFATAEEAAHAYDAAAREAFGEYANVNFTE